MFAYKFATIFSAFDVSYFIFIKNQDPNYKTTNPPFSYHYFVEFYYSTSMISYVACEEDLF